MRKGSMRSFKLKKARPLKTRTTRQYISGPDFGNVRIGVPGDIADHDLNAQFFAVLSRAYGLPAIPIFNSGNRAQTFIGVVQNELAAAVPVTIHLGLLS